jgi:hypothetical protein
MREQAHAKNEVAVESCVFAGERTQQGDDARPHVAGKQYLERVVAVVAKPSELALAMVQLVYSPQEGLPM